MQGSAEPSALTRCGQQLINVEFSAPFCLGETHHYFKQCDLFRSLGLACLDRAVHNY